MNLLALKKHLAVPTAPFRERQVIDHFHRELDRADVPHFEDSYGNLVLGARDAAEYRRKLRGNSRSEPLKLLVAHMDHPGFHALKWLGRGRLSLLWHGGSPLKYLN